MGALVVVGGGGGSVREGVFFDAVGLDWRHWSFIKYVLKAYGKGGSPSGSMSNWVGNLNRARMSSVSVGELLIQPPS